MNHSPNPLRRYAAPLCALGLIAPIFALTRAPYVPLPPSEVAALASRFRFERLPLAEVGDPASYKHIRQVHPSLNRIAAWISSLGAGVTLADLDGDGLPNDLCLVDPRSDLVIVQPVPGTPQRYAPFTLDPSPLPYDPATMAPTGVLAGDFNEDGLRDLLVYYWGRSPVLFLRKTDHSGSLSRSDFVTRELVEGGERWFTTCATQADLDGDGHVDLIIGNYFQDGGQILDANAGGVQVMHEGKAKALNGGLKHLFLWAGAAAGNEPAVHFNEVKDAFSQEVTHSWTLAVGAADLDGDLLPEIYFGNDFGPDRLLHNRSKPGHLEFAELKGTRSWTMPKSCVLGQDSFKGMGVDFGDVNGDGYLDIYVSNIATRFALTESHFLWQSTGDIGKMKEGLAPYIQQSEKLGLSRSGWGWDSRLADFDNDGVLEALQACGFIKGTINRWPELQALGTSNSRIVHDPRLWPSFKAGADLSGGDHDAFFVRSKSGRFENIAEAVGLGTPMVSRGIALADVDGDGRLDFAIANQWEPSFFFHNLSPTNNAFLGLHLLLPSEAQKSEPLQARLGHLPSDPAARPAIGASVRVTLPDGRHLVAQVDGGAGHSGHRSPDIHFGLGALPADATVSAELRWRDSSGGLRQTTLQLSAGWHTIVLGQTPTL